MRAIDAGGVVGLLGAAARERDRSDDARRGALGARGRCRGGGRGGLETGPCDGGIGLDLGGGRRSGGLRLGRGFRARRVDRLRGVCGRLCHDLGLLDLCVIGAVVGDIFRLGVGGLRVFGSGIPRLELVRLADAGAAGLRLVGGRGNPGRARQRFRDVCGLAVRRGLVVRAGLFRIDRRVIVLEVVRSEGDVVERVHRFGRVRLEQFDVVDDLGTRAIIGPPLGLHRIALRGHVVVGAVVRSRRVVGGKVLGFGRHAGLVRPLRESVRSRQVVRGLGGRAKSNLVADALFGGRVIGIRDLVLGAATGRLVDDLRVVHVVVGERLLVGVGVMRLDDDVARRNLLDVRVVNDVGVIVGGRGRGDARGVEGGEIGLVEGDLIFDHVVVEVVIVAGHGKVDIDLRDVSAEDRDAGCIEVPAVLEHAVLGVLVGVRVGAVGGHCSLQTGRGRESAPSQATALDGLPAKDLLLPPVVWYRSRRVRPRRRRSR
ncbi:hypothetical protein NE358_06080 [Sphingomonas sp. G5]